MTVTKKYHSWSSTTFPDKL